MHKTWTVKDHLIFCIAILFAAVFCILWTHDHSSGLELSVTYPKEVKSINFKTEESHVLIHKGDRFTYDIDYPWQEVERIGVILSVPDGTNPSGSILLQVEDASGNVLTGKRQVSEVIRSDYTFFDFSGARIVPSEKLRLCIVSDTGEIEISKLTVRDKNGSVRYEGPQIRLIASSFSERVTQGLLLMVILLFSLLYLMWYGRTDFSTENLFAVLFLMTGTIFMITFAPLAEPDAGNHFRRVLAITQGDLLGSSSPDGGLGSDMAWQEAWGTEDNAYLTLYGIGEDLGLHMADMPAHRMNYSNVALYSPVAYTAPVIGAAIARLFTDRLMVIIYAAKLSNFLITGILLFMAVKITPFGKKYILWITLLPIFIQQAIAVAPDSVLSALVFLLLALVLRYRYTEEVVTRKTLISLFLILFMLSQYKIVYMLFALMVLLIPEKRYGSRTRCVIHVVIMALFTAVASLAWFMISWRMMQTGSVYPLAESQKMKMFARPVEFVLAIFRTYYTDGCSYVSEVLGHYLGSYSVETNPTILLILFILFLIDIMMVRRYAQKLDLFATSLLTFIMLATVLLITTAEFVSWNDGINMIYGIQGRYFLPFLFPLFVVLCGNDSSGEGSGAGASECRSIFLRGLLLICFIPQVFVHYIYGTI